MNTFVLRSGPLPRLLCVGDRIVNRRALAEGDAAEDEVVSLGEDQAYLTGGSVDYGELVVAWEHADGAPIQP